MTHNHFIEKYQHCGIVLNQCRCMSKDKEIRYGVCQGCLERNYREKIINEVVEDFERSVCIGLETDREALDMKDFEDYFKGNYESGLDLRNKSKHDACLFVYQYGYLKGFQDCWKDLCIKHLIENHRFDKAFAEETFDSMTDINYSEDPTCAIDLWLMKKR